MNIRVQNGERLPVILGGKSYPGAINCIDGVWMVAIRGATFNTGDIIVIGGDDWLITKKNITTIRGIESAAMVKI